MRLTCFDSDGQIVHDDPRSKVKKGPVNRIIAKLEQANFKVTDIEKTEMYTKTYTYERESDM